MSGFKKLKVIDPLTKTVGFYLMGALFLLPLALLDMGILLKKKAEPEKMRLHFLFVGGFLVVAHIAKIFGMVNPEIIDPHAGGRFTNKNVQGCLPLADTSNVFLTLH